MSGQMVLVTGTSDNLVDYGDRRIIGCELTARF
jgi:hypothetical protein